MGARLGAIGFGILLAGTASANGAMGLGLEMFDLRYWYAYVIAMVVLEAWLIGRWAKVALPASLGISILANLLTGVMCGGIGCFAPLLHGAMWAQLLTLIRFSLPSCFGWLCRAVWLGRVSGLAVLSSQTEGHEVRSSFAHRTPGHGSSWILLIPRTTSGARIYHRVASPAGVGWRSSQSCREVHR